jgi:predicted MFS family arabinose efflux permease
MGILFLSGSASLMMLALSHSLGIITMAVILSFLSDTGLGVVVTSEVSDMVKTDNAKSQFTLSAFTNWIDIGSALGPLVIFSLISEISFHSIFVSASVALLLYALFIRRINR